MPKVTTIEQLRKQIEAKEKLVGKLMGARAKAMKAVQRIDRKIATLTGAAVGVVEAPRWKPAAEPQVGGRRRRRAGGTLADFVRDVLAQSKGGMRAKEIVDAVLQAGYKSKSKYLAGMVKVALRKVEGIKKLKRGLYAIVG